MNEEDILRARYTAAQVAAHNTRDDCWITYDGFVYNLTPYLRFHPGGIGCLSRHFGCDITEVCHAVHKYVPIVAHIGPLRIGVLDGPPQLAPASEPSVPPGFTLRK